METRFSLFAAAIVLLFPTMVALADEALDAATAEMNAALGIVPPFIELLPEGVPGEFVPTRLLGADRVRLDRVYSLRRFRLQ
jgi:hypothetical protein